MCRLAIYAHSIRNHCNDFLQAAICVCIAAVRMYACSNCIFEQIAERRWVWQRGIRLICIVCSLQTAIQRKKEMQNTDQSEKFLIVTNGYGKIMQLIYWHIIGWLQYGNFVNAICLMLMLLQNSLYGSHSMVLCRCIGFMQKGIWCWSFAFSVNTRLFVSANRWRILYMVIKLRDRMWEVRSQWQRVTFRLLLCQCEQSVLLRRDTQTIKFEWNESKQEPRSRLWLKWTKNETVGSFK